ncbi:hypothetical protein COU14_02080 [Candidatus Kaiserbacteria bacterium CG10_big_fil_rev_8_21_14_0_10_44_10]|uniref:Resolvase HTH domain-containing protein n=1 Tax=Candidatus Kaiserbacteria bacterium CG10_big_fil_rev_8_21_14_0_10_44_10 TaxID=1974606 RepID=A0A2H0UJJ6_9BACT|nr:MAG: hypothetical protein COU14_02080 [Candidatus Kaiserbacteria bacterium CG10_big_fil_rev_8_21_14_0_10_44_10]
MTLKQVEKELAIKLRKQGKTYNEILQVVPVAKSTLSLWLRTVSLSAPQQQKFTAKKRAAQLRGGVRRKEMRLEQTEEINLLCKKDINKISDRELFFIGIALYWAEGAKKNADKPGVLIDFGNSDPAMLRLFIRWLNKFLAVSENDMTLRLYLHINHKSREASIKRLWSKELGCPVSMFRKTVYKKHNPQTIRKKVNSSYIGLVSVRVKKSTKLNRRIMGWIYAIIATQNLNIA